MRRRQRSDERELLAYLEACLDDLVLSPQLTYQSAAVSRTLELANDDWPESDAARELLWLVRGDRRALGRLQEVFMGRLLQSMLTEQRCLRAGRLVDEALALSYAR